MATWRTKCKQSKILQRMSSLRITVTCLFLLFVLTFWGTVAQTQSGLYAAQQRFFFSMYFLIGGIIPFPGAKLVLGILFANLCAATLTRFTWQRSKLGILLIHLGLLSYFISAFIVYVGTVESNVTLMEGDGTNVSSGYHQWELSVWEQHPAGVQILSVDPKDKNSTKKVMDAILNSDVKPRQVTAIDADGLKSSQEFAFSGTDLSVLILNYYPNSQAYTTQEKIETAARNDSGIKALREIPVQKEPEKNLPGGAFHFTTKDGETHDIFLYGGENSPTTIHSADKIYNVQLRRKRYPMPFTLKLKDFRMTVYPNTQLAKSYESLVEITNKDISRQVLISMNKPLRYKNFTVYQASYAIDESGREFSTLAVVKNVGWTLPYISSGLTFIGLLVHFLMMAFARKNKTV